MAKPLVSICCITYNHAPFIRQCLDGFLMQKGVEYEILIHDDCSTDGTTEIVKEYAAQYPDVIFPLYETENQYSKGVCMDGFNYRRARGKYIAYCEGDDYWIDPYKLQKQVDFLEANPEYSVCFHRYNIVRQEEQVWRKDACDIYLQRNQDGVDLTVDMYLRHWVTQPLTIVYRHDAIDEAAISHLYKKYKDQHLIYHLLRSGKGRLMNFVGGVYREHNGGIHSRTSLKSQCDIAIAVAKELYDVNGTVELKDNLLRTYDWVIAQYSKHKFGIKQCVQYIYKRFQYSKSLKKCVKQISCLL